MKWIIGKLSPVKPKALGPIEPGYLDTSIRSQERRQNDVLPGHFYDPYRRFDAAGFITAMRLLPIPQGRMDIVDEERKERERKECELW